MGSVLHDYQYSVQVKSRFDLLLSDDINNEDPDLLIQKSLSNKKHDNKSTKVTAEKNKQPYIKQSKVSKQTERKIIDDVTPKIDVHKASQLGTNPPTSDFRSNRTSHAVDEEIRVANTDSHTQENDSSQRRGRVGFDRSGFTRSRPIGHEEREFDRHSGSNISSIKPKLKKEGYGFGNVGTIEDELDAELATTDELAPDIIDEVHDQLSAEKPNDVESGPSEQPQRTITLNEYKELKKSSKPTLQLSTKSTRQANDGKDVFSNMVPHNKPKNIFQKVEVPVIEESVTEVQKPAFFEFERATSQRGRNNFDRRFVGSDRRRIGVEFQFEVASAVDRTDSRRSERGAASSFQRGDLRAFDRGRPRNSERGFSRGGGPGFNREGGEGTTHVIGQNSAHDEAGFEKCSTAGELDMSSSTNVNTRGAYRGRGTSLRSRGPFQPRGGFRGPRERFSHFEGPSITAVQPPSMDSDFDFPSLK